MKNLIKAIKTAFLAIISSYSQISTFFLISSIFTNFCPFYHILTISIKISLFSPFLIIVFLGINWYLKNNPKTTPFLIPFEKW
jgi:archaellum biogenesis protein FlaJ (TadC family)